MRWIQSVDRQTGSGHTWLGGDFLLSDGGSSSSRLSAGESCSAGFSLTINKDQCLYLSSGRIPEERAGKTKGYGIYIVKRSTHVLPAER